jgi:phosphomethylpyrimidine synthase
VRDYAAAHGVTDEAALDLGMEEKSVEFVARGATVYPSVAAE